MNQIPQYYYEIGSELIARPSSLADIIESEGCPSSLIYCNAPSDCDLLDVILRKRGLNSKKLIGHVSPTALKDSLEALAKGELNALIVTDISARGLENVVCDMVINYSIPKDPETYIHRTSFNSSNTKIKKVISLVGALDITNFHYLKKFVDSEFVKAELPSNDDMAKSKLGVLKAKANSKIDSIEQTYKDLAKQALDEGNLENLLAYLIHSALEVVPSLSISASRQSSSSDDEDRSEDRRSSRGGRWDRDSGSRNGRRRSDRDSDYKGADFKDDDYSDNRSADDSGDSDRRDRRRSRERSGPPAKDVRIYLGQGKNDSFSEQNLIDLFSADGSNFKPENIKKVTIRGHYGWLDVPESEAEQYVSHLENCNVGGKPLFVRKAAVIPALRDNAGSDNNESSPDNDGASDEGSDYSDNEGSDDNFSAEEAF